MSKVSLYFTFSLFCKHLFRCRKYRHEQNGQIIKTKRKTKPEKTNDEEEQINQIQVNYLF